MKVDGKGIEVVTHAKLLGVTISADLKWNTHITNLIKKVSSRLYFLRQLKRVRIPVDDLLLFYVTCIRPVTEYACRVFHTALTKYLSDDLERLQKRAMRIIFPELSYSEALDTSGLDSLLARREMICAKLFDEIVNDKARSACRR